MRGKKPTIQQRQEQDVGSGEPGQGNDDVVGKLSNMREQLQKKQDEQGDVWNGLVD